MGDKALYNSTAKPMGAALSFECWIFECFQIFFSIIHKIKIAVALVGFQDY